MPKENKDNTPIGGFIEIASKVQEETLEEMTARLDTMREKSQSEAYPNYPQYPVDGYGLRTDMGLKNTK